MADIASIDIGATNLRVGLVREGGEILRQHSERTDGEGVMEQIYGQLDSYPEFSGIGIASVGPLDSKKGIITNPPNINIRNLGIVKLLEKKYGKNAILLNDCVASVLAERAFGMGKGLENLVYVTLSTGIGAGVIVDGNVILGKEGNAHEVGHFIVDTESKLKCGCGSYGHWEAYCAGKNIPNFARHLLESEYAGKESALKRVGALSTEQIFKLAATDKVASEIVDRIGRINGIMIANIINTYDPELITIGGSIAINNKERVLAPILKYAKEYSINKMPRIAITPLEEKIWIYGGAAGFLHFDGRGML